MKDLARSLRARRLELDLSQEDVAYEAGLSVRHYQLLESLSASGQNNPKYRTLYDVARALSTTVCDLTEYDRRATSRRLRAPRRP